MTHAMKRHDDEDKDRDDNIVRDGEGVRVPMVLMDATQRAIAAHMNPAVLHRPGFVTDSDIGLTASREAYQAHVDELYRRHDEALSWAWYVGDDAAKPRTDTKDARSADPYIAYDRNVSEAWR